MKYGETRELLWMKNSQNKRICKVMAFAALGVAQAVCISAAETEQLPTDAQRTALQEMTQRKPDAGMLQNEWRDRQRLAASQITNGSGSTDSGRAEAYAEYGYDDESPGQWIQDYRSGRRRRPEIAGTPGR